MQWLLTAILYRGILEDARSIRFLKLRERQSRANHMLTARRISLDSFPGGSKNRE